jgi:hypothetical protein
MSSQQRKHKDHLEDGRLAVRALVEKIRANRSKDSSSSAAAKELLEIAVFSTSMVEEMATVYPAWFFEASKHYAWYPMLISRKGRDTNQKLLRVSRLPLGTLLPFKTVGGKALNDNLWSLIEQFYWAKRYTLRPPTRANSREWSEAIAAHYTNNFHPPDVNKLISMLGIDPGWVAKKRSRAAQDRIRKEFGGVVLRAETIGKEQHWYVMSAKKRVKELDAREATRFEIQLRRALVTPPTDGDEKEALVDAIEKRLRSRLR